MNLLWSDMKIFFKKSEKYFSQQRVSNLFSQTFFHKSKNLKGTESLKISLCRYRYKHFKSVLKGNKHLGGSCEQLRFFVLGHFFKILNFSKGSCAVSNGEGSKIFLDFSDILVSGASHSALHGPMFS